MTSALAAVEIKILDPRLPLWGFPVWGSSLAAGLDLHACIEEPLCLEPLAAARLISAGFALKIGDPDWCALVLPRSGRGHGEGLVLGNLVGVIDADYEGPCFVSAWNRNPQGPIAIAPGDRIAQLIFTRIARPQLKVVSEFFASAGRGRAGFGSTGRGAAPGDGSGGGSCRDRAEAPNSSPENRQTSPRRTPRGATADRPA
jgi:dUTP diphosphatase